MMDQCWANAVPASLMLAQHSPSIGPILRVRLDASRSGVNYAHIKAHWTLPDWVSEYCITSLSAQSWQYRDKKKTDVVIMPYFFLMTSRFLHSEHYRYKEPCTAHSMRLNSLEHCICTTPIPANTKHLYNICRTLDQRLRRWSNVLQTL